MPIGSSVRDGIKQHLLFGCCCPSRPKSDVSQQVGMRLVGTNFHFVCEAKMTYSHAQIEKGSPATDHQLAVFGINDGQSPRAIRIDINRPPLYLEAPWLRIVLRRG